MMNLLLSKALRGFWREIHIDWIVLKIEHLQIECIELEITLSK